MSRNLVLIASYPRSGSTWLRVIFENLRRPSFDPVSINAMTAGYYGLPRRLLFDDIVPVNAADLLPPEIDTFLPEVFRQLSAAIADTIIIKAHDQACRAENGQWLFPPECVRAVVHVVRHPFDVAVSYAHHLGMDLTRAIELMAGRDGVVVANPERRLPFQLHEHIGSWSEHVESWRDNGEYRVSLARFEDLFGDPLTGFRRLTAEAGLPATDDRISAAVRAATFARLQSEERSQGFRERPRTATAFFRTGRPSSWGQELTAEMRESICHDHGSVMRRMGYEPDGSALPISS